jgi:hypothetical protein
VLDGEPVLPFQVDEQDAERPAARARLVGDEVQHDGGVLAGREDT